MNRHLRLVLLGILLSLAVVVPCMAEEVLFAFEQDSYTLRNKTSLVVKIISDDIAFTGSTEWRSTDESVAEIDKGRITAKSPGTAIVSCVRLDAHGYSYEARATVTVVQPITKLTAPELSTMLGPGDTYQFTPTIKPSYASNQVLHFTSTNEKVATVDENGLISAVGIGNCTVYAEPTDGSRAKAAMTVRVKSFHFSEKEFILDERKTLAINIPPHVGKLYLRVMGNVVDVGNVTSSNLRVKNEFWVQGDTIYLNPTSAGTGSLIFMDDTYYEKKGKDGFLQTLRVRVTPQALYSERNFPRLDYNAMVKEPDNMTGKPVFFSGFLTNITLMDSEPCYTVATLGKREHNVTIFLPWENKHSFNIGDRLTVHGYFVDPDIAVTLEDGKFTTVVTPRVRVEMLNGVNYNPDLLPLEVYPMP